MNLGCVLLASGLARRFGRNKLLEEFGGKTLAERTLDAIPGDLFSKIVTVTAYDEIEAMARARGFCTLRNTQPQRGIGSTIKLGVALMEGTDACMICVCDQPYISENTLRRMIANYSGGIVAVAFGKQRGNPVLFPGDLYGELLAIEDGRSGSSVIERHGDMLTLFNTGSKRELMDVDFVDDIDRF